MDLRACYQLGVNPYVNMPVGFAQFTEAIRPVTVFRTLTNEPPVA